mmetsp:Transcript_93449/g.302594  ORF Transcript_93449/g.302594 Transcript_93449/m.302594 type:complete len:585 (-) Transcript_93449:48-1802(-)|eukprot:CAMPEP_0203899750 /NCGR_PEP_ID=MMETSP0359-20131031/42114_1 /ASSEMBLY_ACC=CAM_ASM_000338 /TAXON_ID=268821 /ORGANISM="Scrippsiella Hangoei, Strain SHTV-5" /LENGTH=584 /DNA_ID=CAMNT_0050823063 /DNA_START=61 /DNA_END=1815 /DNA_ORIENTATION=-
MAAGGLSFGAATSGYEDDPQARLLNEMCVLAFKKLHEARKGRHNYIFEIGSGTGGTSSFLIPTLNPYTTRYVFSDLSQAFLSNARVRFGNFPFMEYAIFNGDIHPANQGFASHEINQILATNVIHATMHLASTMATINILLAPGGHIVFNEVHNGGTLIEDLTYGLTDGWWMMTDVERRTTYPLMQTPKWNALFTACGFTPVWHTPDEGHAFTNQSCLVARSGGGMPRTYQEAQPCLQLDPSASYLITGAVGGLGLISALIMLERGARHLHFVSRRDRVPKEAMALYSRIANSNCTIKRERCNVSSAREVARCFLEAPDRPPCQGIVHGAGVLSDGLVIRQTRKKFEDVFGPKHFGAWNLHCSSSHKARTMQLSIMFSSASGFLGSIGQSNHSSANAGIDGLIAMTSSLGLPGASISWGAVAEVGYAARHAVSTAERSVRFDHAWLALEALHTKPFSHVCINPGSHVYGQGQAPLRAATYAGVFARFRHAGQRRAPRKNLLQSSDNGPSAADAVVEAAEAADAALPVQESKVAEDEGNAEEYTEVFKAMTEIHSRWQQPQSSQPSKRGGGGNSGARSEYAAEVY